MDDALKTRGNKYSNVETLLLFVQHQNFWPRAWMQSCEKLPFQDDPPSSWFF